jgi:hypothetical protein
MYKFITKLLNRKPPVPFTISFEAIPEWVRDRRQNAKDVLTAETNEPVTSIRNGMAQLQHVVNSIAGSEHDPALHPKLKSIAKNSLPLFIKAMNSSLSKELPDDVEEFYSVAVESIKSCINSSRGQGRYLQAVFPEEMKTVKTGIDAIGHEINSITTSLAKYRRERSQLDAVIEVYDSLVTVRSDLQNSVGKDQRIGARITEIKDRIKSIEQELGKITSDEKMKNVHDLEMVVETTQKRRDESNRRYTSMTMTASHVFRKAEKIAVKQHNSEEAATVRQTMEILSDHSLPECNVLIRVVSVSIPIALRMIETGEILLKNKEERAIFSDTTRFCNDIGASCRELKHWEDECRSAEQMLIAHPLLAKTKSLEREKTQLEIMLSKESLLREDLSLWKDKNNEKIPLLREELNRKIKDIVSEPVEIQIHEGAVG